MFKIYHFKKLLSTNDKAKNFRENSVIIAERQSKGRGRFKRHWSSSNGGIYLSIKLTPKIKEKINFLTIIAALSSLKAIKNTYKIETKIKWPNDLVYNKKKLCGVLTKTHFSDKIDYVIVGIGINTNNQLPKSLKNKAISLKNVLNKKIDNKIIINNLLKNFEGYYKEYQNNSQKLEGILDEFKTNCETIGKTIKIRTLKGTFKGKAVKIDDDGCLLLKQKDKFKRIVEGTLIY